MEWGPVDKLDMSEKTNTLNLNLSLTLFATEIPGVSFGAAIGAAITAFVAMKMKQRTFKLSCIFP